MLCLLSGMEGEVMRMAALRVSWALAVLAIAAFASLGAAATASAASVPSIEGELASHITATDATLEAQINPQEASPGAVYQFQLVKEPSEFASEILCPPGPWGGFSGCISTPSASAFPIGIIPNGSQAASVTLDLAGAGVTLQPGTTYHYRVLAAHRIMTEDTLEWEEPTIYGADQTFTTLPGLPPLIEGESVSHVTQNDATLEAQINTEGLETSYQFRLESGCLPPRACAEITVYPLPSGKLLGSFVGQSVSLDLNSAGVTLRPEVEYAYSVTATSAAGQVTGGEQRFITPSEPQPANAPGSDTGGELPVIQFPPSASPLHHRRHKYHRRHKRRHHRSRVQQARHAGQTLEKGLEPPTRGS